MTKHAIILAGGRGTRLRPYTVVLPKPLMPIGEYPILEVIIRQLAAAGFDRISLAVNHQAEIIKAFFGDGARWNIRIDYSLEKQPLGTMGPLKLVESMSPYALVMNGDILTDLNFAAFHDDHVAGGAVFSVSSARRRNQVDYGVLEIGPSGQLTGFHEKPTVDYEVSMGVYMVSREVLAHIPEGVTFGFDELMLKLIGIGERVQVRPFDGYWLDIGRPDDYMKAIDEFDAMKARFF
ncbi:MAG: sugar phosphate nucleotidyltransferase [Rhodospirillaceae bacterium]